jgi:hypothetical protein
MSLHGICYHLDEISTFLQPTVFTYFLSMFITYLCISVNVPLYVLIGVHIYFLNTCSFLLTFVCICSCFHKPFFMYLFFLAVVFICIYVQNIWCLYFASTYMFFLIDICWLCLRPCNSLFILFPISAFFYIFISFFYYIKNPPQKKNIN